MADEEHALNVQTVAGDYTLYGRPCEISSFSFIPTERNEPAERTVFNSAKKEKNAHAIYDRLFHQPGPYNNKLHRDDREHAKSRGLHVNDEERPKPVPTLASSVYGHRLPSDLDPPDRKHVRVAHVKAEFFRRNGLS